MRTTITTIVTLLLALSLGACAELPFMGDGGGNDGGAGVAPGAPPPPLVDPPAPGGGGGDPGGAPQWVQPRAGMADTRPVPWSLHGVSGDGRTVRAAWYSGVEPCSVVDSVRVKETDDAVTITIQEGADPAQPDVACIDLAVLRGTRVQLDAPLGDRDLIDGATGAAPPAADQL